MYSLDYYWSRTPLLRRLLLWKNQARLNWHLKKEQEKLSNNPQHLQHFERQIYSQNGEDGLIEEIFQRIGTTNKFFAEFGVEDASECNGRYLIENKQWSGLWIDGSTANVTSAKKKFSGYPVKIVDRFITKENINHLFKEAQVPLDLDLLSIDIDGNDYWVWQALKEYKARVVIIEYNASYPPPKSWIMPYKADHQFDGTRYYGASLQALFELGRQLGYTLVGCDSQGVNAFFVLDSLAEKHFNQNLGEPKYHYSSPKYRELFFGHPKGKGPWRD